MNLSLDQLAPHLGLPRDLLEAANRANLTPSTILLTPISRISDILRVKVPLAQQLVSRVARAVAPSTSRLDVVFDLERGVGTSTSTSTAMAPGASGTTAPGDAGDEDAGQVASGAVEPLIEDANGDTRLVRVRNKDSNSDSVSGHGKGKGQERERERGKWISTGDEGMDTALGGGLRRGALYEITGESAAGKSHLALTLALSAQLPSLTSSPGASLILTSERELSTSRLIQLSKSLLATHEPFSRSASEAEGGDLGGGQDPEHKWEQGQGRVKSLLDNVLTNRVGDVDALEHALNYAVPAILESRLRTSGRGATRSRRLGAGGDRIRSTGSNSRSTKSRIGSNGSEGTDPQAVGPHAGATSGATSVDGPQRIASNGTTASSSCSGSSTARHRGQNALPVRLIILDSITALFRGGTSSNDERPIGPSSLSLTERSKHLCIVADALKSLAVTYDLAIVVINQVSDVFVRGPPLTNSGGSTPPTSSFTQTQAFLGGKIDENPPMLYASQARWFSGQSNTLGKEASLGIVWANAINVRIMLSRTGRRRLLHQSDLRPSKRHRPGATGDSLGTAQHHQGHRQSSPSSERLNNVTNANAGADADAALTLTQQGIGVEVDDVKPTLIRRMHVVFSPFSASSTVDYVITPSGVHSLPESYKAIDVTETARRKERQAEKDRQNGSDDIDSGSGHAGDISSNTRMSLGSTPIGGRSGDGDENADGLEEGSDEWDVFDDFGELPDEFWQGQYGLDDEGRVVVPSADYVAAAAAADGDRNILSVGTGVGNSKGDGGGGVGVGVGISGISVDGVNQGTGKESSG
ncbi:hypothetical protein I317_01836 [Kwoniella heveanensis CBS 569]|nr:hypothetical protein I317_01836 [Kwoniella heveanensis CBS 569]